MVIKCKFFIIEGEIQSPGLIWNFEFLQYSTKHFLNSRYEYANEWIDDLIASQFSIYFVYKTLKILIFFFLLRHVKTCPHI